VSRWAWLVVPALAAAAACSTNSGSNRAVRNDGGAGSGGTAGAGTSSGGSSGGAGTPSGTFNLACSAPQLGSPVLRLLNSDEFTQTISDIFPQVSGMWTSTLPANSVSSYGFDNDSSQAVGNQLAQAMLDTATAVATAVTGTPLATILPCSSSTADRACADQFITQYGRRLFRRTVTADEHTRYLTFFDSALAKSDFKTALKWVLVGLIQSPNAVYRSEIGAVASDGSRSLTPAEVASELAYTYTGSTPSDALLTQAESGTIDVVALAKMLLATDAGKQTLQHFFEAYLDYPRVASLDRAGIPTFDAIRTDMIQETRAFIDQVVVQGNGGLKDLLTANTTNPSAALATYYGLPAPSAPFTSVTRMNGIGVLAQGSILASRALPDGSSPTQRGLLVYSKLLCHAIPSPPAGVGTIEPPAPGVLTTRQRYEEQHAVAPLCAGCHKQFDPIGFGFEHFDEGGRYRATEGGLPINTVSDVPNSDGTALVQFTDQESLARGLADQEVVYQCAAAYLATYAFGTGDACLGASRVTDFKAGTLSIADYYAALAAEPHFTRRAAQ
jgi:Protein of unknown function (DUF1588)/Protein of unknown function (DUF1592)/Protein of unknown function (DUF1595)/Protein of unknown function (DUF1587)